LPDEVQRDPVTQALRMDIIGLSREQALQVAAPAPGTPRRSTGTGTGTFS